MERNNKNKTDGFLLITAIILIVIIGFVGTILLYQFIGSTRSAENSIQSNDALYIASSGIEIAKRDLVKNNVACSAITGGAKYNNVALFNGVLNVTGSSTITTALLSASINNTANSIQLNNASSFSQDGGIAAIENEYIKYSSVSGNTLQNVVRGIGGTAPYSHGAATLITQNQCKLTAQGGVPNLTSALSSKRTIQSIILGQAMSFPGGKTATLASCGNVTLSGNSWITNPTASYDNTIGTYTGFTVITNGTLTINGASGGTAIGNPPTASSTSGNYRGDVKTGYPISNCASGGLFALFFTQSFNTMFNAATVVGTGGITIHGNNKTENIGNTGGTLLKLIGDIDVNGKNNVLNIGSTTQPVILFVQGNLNLQGSQTNFINIGNIGGSKMPVIVIVTGNITDSGASTISLYGLLYARGQIGIAGTSNVTGQGMMVSESSSNINGNVNLNLDPSILNKFLELPGNYTTNSYNPSITSAKESFK